MLIVSHCTEKEDGEVFISLCTDEQPAVVSLQSSVRVNLLHLFLFCFHYIRHHKVSLLIDCPTLQL